MPETTLFEPTILTGVTSEMAIVNTEIFGPIIAIQEYEKIC